MGTHENAFNYIRKTYGVPADFGRRVIINGKPGTIVEDRGHYIGVQFDTQPAGMVHPCHPTWEAQYLEDVTPPKKEFVYSLSDEPRRFEMHAHSFGELIAEALKFDSVETLIGRSYCVAERLPSPDASTFFYVQELLRHVRANAKDKFGEWAEDFPKLTEDKIQELNKLVSDFLDANVEVDFFMIRKQSIQIKTFTAEDFKEAEQ